MPTTAKVRTDGAWAIDARLPSDWSQLVRRHQAGFFHTPPGLRAGAPEGEPIYARFLFNGEVAGIAAGIRTQCRLSGFFRHLYFPTWPAFTDPELRGPAMAKLATSLHGDAVAEVRWDSFDAAATAPPAARPTRLEYLIDLDQVRASAAWPISSHHRRIVRRGERAGWTLRELYGAEAKATLGRVLETSTVRHAQRGVQMQGEVPPVVTDAADVVFGWGVTTYAAFAGDDLLAAVLIGRGDRRAYYIMGGGTPAGYDVGASIWLQAQVASRLADADLTHYNLGGASVGASDPAHADYGLHRFKTGFGASVVPCGGDRWILFAAHLRSHQLFGWAARVAR